MLERSDRLSTKDWQHEVILECSKAWNSEFECESLTSIHGFGDKRHYTCYEPRPKWCASAFGVIDPPLKSVTYALCASISYVRIHCTNMIFIQLLEAFDRSRDLQKRAQIPNECAVHTETDWIDSIIVPQTTRFPSCGEIVQHQQNHNPTHCRTNCKRHKIYI